MSRIPIDQEAARLSEISGVTTQSNEDRIREQAAESAHRATFLEGVGAALMETTPAVWAREYLSSGYDRDPNWHLDDKTYDQLAGDLAPDLGARLGLAVSFDHAIEISVLAHKEQEFRRRLASRGWQGSAMRIGASITDPVFLGAALATGGLGAAAEVGGMSVRLANLARSGLIVGGTFATVEATRHIDSPDMGAGDVLAAGLGGFGFGAGAAATRGSGRLIRFFGGGTGQAAGTGADVALRSLSGDRQASDDLLWNLGKSFAMGGVFNAIHPTRSKTPIERTPSAAVDKAVADTVRAGGSLTVDGEVLVREGVVIAKGGAEVFQRDPIEAAGERLKRDVEYRDAQELMRQTGAVLSEQGRAYFKEQTPEAQAARSESVAKTVSSDNSGSVKPIRESVPEPALGSLGPVPQHGYEFQARTLPMVYRETDLSSAMAFLPSPVGITENQGRLYFANHPDLALGQGENKGVMIAVDPKGLSGQADLSKPMARHVWENGVTELQMDATQGEYLRGVRAIDISPEAQKGNYWGRFNLYQKHLTDAGWTITKAEDGTVMLRAPVLDSFKSDFPTGVQEAVERAFKPIESPPKEAIGATASDAAEHGPPPRKPTSLNGFDASNIYASSPAFPYLRMDMPGQTAQSRLPIIALASRILGPDPLPGDRGTSPSFETAPEWKMNQVGRYLSKADGLRDQLYGQYEKSVRDAGGKSLTRNEWHEEVGRAVRRPRGEYSDDPTINEAADAHRKNMAELKEVGVEHGVPGYDKIDENDNYLTRIANNWAKDRANHQYGEQNLVLVLTEAIVKGSEQVTPERAVMLAKVWIKNSAKVYDGTNVQRGRIFSEESQNELEAMLKEVKPDITPAEIDDILWIAKGPPTGAKPVPRARRRISMDETHRQEVFDEHGNSLGTLGIEDLLENDVSVLDTMYAHQIYGAAALSESLRVLKDTPAEVLSTVPQLVAKISKQAHDLGLYRPDGSLPWQVAWNMKQIEVLAKITAGIPRSENTALLAAARILRNVNIFRLFTASTGVRNMGEMADSMSQMGVRNTLAILPEIKAVWKRGVDGKMENDFLREVDDIGGFMAVRSNARLRPRLGLDDGQPTQMGKAEEISARMSRFATDVTGVTPGQQFMTAAGASGFKNRWADFAFRGQELGNRRLLAMGMHPPMAERIAGQIRDHATTETGITGAPKVVRMNDTTWADQEAASAYRVAMSKTVRRMTLSGDESQLAMWMTKPMGKLVAQFRIFNFMSWSNKLLFNVSMRDRTALANIFAQTVAGGLTYIATVYIRSLGKPDAQDFRKKMLEPSMVFRGAFNNAVYSSVIPTAVDVAAQGMGGRAPIFSYARTTGLGTAPGAVGALTQNPTVDWINAIMRTPGSLQAPFAPDYDFSKEDVRNIENGLWIPQMYGIKNALDQLTRNLPSRSVDTNP